MPNEKTLFAPIPNSWPARLHFDGRSYHGIICRLSEQVFEYSGKGTDMVGLRVAFAKHEIRHCENREMRLMRRLRFPRWTAADIWLDFGHSFSFDIINNS